MTLYPIPFLRLDLCRASLRLLCVHDPGLCGHVDLRRRQRDPPYIEQASRKYIGLFPMAANFLEPAPISTLCHYSTQALLRGRLRGSDAGDPFNDPSQQDDPGSSGTGRGKLRT